MPPPVTRSRHRNKSRGKSRHRSSQSTARPTSDTRTPRTKSNPPVPRLAAHNKTPQEIKEDHEYVKRVLAYLDQPGPSPEKKNLNKNTGKLVKPASGSRKVENVVCSTIFSNKVQGQISRTKGSTITNDILHPVSCEIFQGSLATPVLSIHTKKVSESEVIITETNTTGAIHKVESSTLKSINSHSKKKSNLNAKHLTKTSKLSLEIPTVDENVRSVSLSIDSHSEQVEEQSFDSLTCSQPLQPSIMEDTNTTTASAINSIDGLCAMLAKMGADKVNQEKLVSLLPSVLSSLKDQQENSKFKNESKTDQIMPPCSSLVDVVSTSNETSSLSNEVGIIKDCSPLKCISDNSLNTSLKLSKEELQDERKARKEAKKAKKLDPNLVKREECEKKQSMEDKENSDKLAASTSTISLDKSKADLKKERRAIQEAQRTAKQKVIQEKVDAKQAAVEGKTATTGAATMAKKNAPARSGAGKHRGVVKGGSLLPFCGLLKEQGYVPDDPAYYKDVHINFAKLAKDLHYGLLSGPDAESVATLNGLHIFLGQYCAPDNTDLERDVLAKLHPNINYLKHYDVYSPSIENIFKLFRDTLHRVAPTVTQTMARVTAAREAEAKALVEAAAAADITCVATNIITPFEQIRSTKKDTHDSVWTMALRDVIVQLREWIVLLIDKLYKDSANQMIEEMCCSFRHGKSVLIYGFCPLMVEGIWVASAMGNQMTVYVMDHQREGQADRTLGILANYHIYGGRVIKVLLADLKTVMTKVNIVLLPVNFIAQTGAFQGLAGTHLVRAVADSMRVPVITVAHTMHFSDRNLISALKDNKLCPPSEQLWGIQPYTKRRPAIIRRSKSGKISKKSATAGVFSATTATPLETVPMADGRPPPLAHGVVDRLRVNAGSCLPDPRRPVSVDPLAAVETLLVNGCLSACDEGADFCQPLLPASVPCCCFKYDVCSLPLHVITDEFKTDPAYRNPDGTAMDTERFN